MKHLSFTVLTGATVALAIAVSMSGCGHATESQAQASDTPQCRKIGPATVATLPSDATLGDSLAWLGGQQQGLEFKAAIEEYEQREGHHVDIDEFKRGLAESLALDSTARDYMMGMRMGVQMASLRIEAQQNGQDLNPEIFYDMVSRYLLADTLPPESSLEANFTKFQQLYSRLQEKGSQRQAIEAEEEHIASEALSAD